MYSEEPRRSPHAATLGGLLEVLRCPSCAGALEFRPVPDRRMPGRAFGLLTCGCPDPYPVVDGVPLFSRRAARADEPGIGPVPIPGTEPENLRRLVEAGAGGEALVRLLALPLAAPSPLDEVKPLLRLLEARPLHQLGLAWRRGVVRRWLESAGQRTAFSWFRLLFGRSLVAGDMFDYFCYRFAQPRHLAGLALLTLLPAGEKPILDLACGCGHLTHYLTRCEKRHRVVGLDLHFHKVWIAKTYVAPAGSYVCGDVGDGLPFAGGVFRSVVCSDAFHFFAKKMECVEEVDRCAPQGDVILARVGNRLVEPNEGEELAPEGYAELLKGGEVRAFHEDELVDGYLKGSTPDLSAPIPLESLRTAKWLSFLRTEDERVLGAHGRFPHWPHAVGRLGVNPIYRKEAGFPRNRVRYHFRFPSSWYRFENERMREYHCPEVFLEGDFLRRLGQGDVPEGAEALVRDFVLIGLPDRYSP